MRSRVLLGLAAALALAVPAAAQPFPPDRRVVSPPWFGPETCKAGFVWREACGPQDRVCVPAAERDLARRQNIEAAGRRQGGGAYGADTCLPGFVWREACTGDQVCVSPGERQQARQQNALAGARRLVGDMSPATCADGFVWREACPGDLACVSPADRDTARRQNARAGARRAHEPGAYGPDSCHDGYVWREACPNDHVCVPPEDRARAADQNREHAASRYTRAGWCDAYAASSAEHVHQLDMSGELARCDLGGPRWTKDYHTHFSWCLGVPWSSALAEIAARRAEMESCGANRQAFCQQYATTAVSQQQANVGFNCGLTGDAWQANAAAHQGWCLAQPSLHYPRRETEGRQQALRRCLELLNYWNQQNAQQAQGVRSARIFNCVPGGAPIHVWTLGSDGSADSHGPLAAGAPCDAGDPFVKQLTPGVLFRFVAVDPQMAQCGGRNDPNYVTCIRDEFFLRGDAGGPEVTLYVPRLP